MSKTAKNLSEPCKGCSHEWEGLCKEGPPEADKRMQALALYPRVCVTTPDGKEQWQTRCSRYRDWLSDYPAATGGTSSARRETVPRSGNE